MNPPADETDPRPSDSPFLFLTLLAARRAGYRMLESLARDWLAEVGVHVVVTAAPDTPIPEQESSFAFVMLVARTKGGPDPGREARKARALDELASLGIRVVLTHESAGA